ncbi:subtilisin-like protein [Ceraceosorus bombacis]|uniref:tripeptidyl-peptidase II n=1 Tax=Ceraceosorus bombacis TaxID=401625 RepID=A0A0P1BMU9_9BASI|nr:subtilisin-like protein [Ceraceosorus bombacis]
MRFTTFTALAIVLASMAVAAPAPSAMRVKESVTMPSGWVRRGPVAAGTEIPLSIALKQRAFADLESEILAVSDPNSPRYGKFLSREQVSSYLTPSAESAAAVRRWLEEHSVKEDLSRRSFAGDWVRATVPVERASAMLGGAEFAEFLNERTGEVVVRALEYSVPESVFDHVDLVGPTTYFGKPLAHRAPSRIAEWLPVGYKPHADETVVHADNRLAVNVAAAIPPPACTTTNQTTLTCIRQLYGTIDYKVQKPNSQFIGISGFLEEYPNDKDFNQFLSTERPDALAANYKYRLTQIDGGGNDQSKPGVEANLDVQTVAAISFNIPSTYYSNGGRPPFNPDQATPTNTNEPYTTEFEYLLSQQTIPSVVSTSYGDDEQTVPRDYAVRVCGEIAGLAARGVSMVFSSGDNGVGSDGNCVSNDGKKTRKFLPAFPASCPYSITVGGTEAYAPEVAVSSKIGGFFAGGGFSEYFARPAYQDNAVKGYLKTLGKKHAGLFNPNGRAYPDIAAQASRYLIVVGGRYVRVGGTSASGPTIASIIALLNDARAAVGRPNLGWINPLLYYGQPEQVLTDITSGSSAGCDTDGFPAAKGWDPVTGFGTPNFKKLLAAATA